MVRLLRGLLGGEHRVTRWEQAMDVLRRHIRYRRYHRTEDPSMLMVDCQVVKGARGGRSFHEPNGMARFNGAKRTIAIDYLGLPVAASVIGAHRHDVRAGRELLFYPVCRRSRPSCATGASPS